MAKPCDGQICEQRNLGKILWILAISVAAAVAAPAANAKTWYVAGAAPGASDSNPGTNLQPLRTIQSAIDRASDGDTVIVRAATYNGEISLDKDIVLKGMPGARITTNFHGQGTGISIRSSNCTVEGFRVEYFAMGIAAYESAHNNVRVIGNHTYGCQFHCWIDGNNWLVEKNEFERCIWWARTGDSDYTRMFGSGHIFRGNYIHGTIYPTDIAPLSGSSDYAHNDGIQYYGNNGEILHNVIIEENFFTDFHQGLFWADEQNGTSIQNATIRNNVFWGQTYTPPAGTNLLGLPSWGVLVGKSYGASDIVIESNLFYHIANYMGLRADTDALARKNIVVGAGAGTVYILEGNTVSNIVPGNIIWRVASYGAINSSLDQARNPALRDPSRPLGVDGILWTSDDGWRPTSSNISGYGPKMIDDQSIWIDSDGDNVYDLTEIQLGTDPFDSLDFPILPLNLVWALGMGLVLSGIGAAFLLRSASVPGQQD